MPSALTPMDRTVVRVKQDILVMDITVQVGLLSSLTAYYRYVKERMLFQAPTNLDQ